MAIQIRRGAAANFDATKMVSGELAVSTDGSHKVWATGAAGDCWELADKAVEQNIAPAYSTSSTYAVGDYVLYNNALYRCTTAIATAEAWTAAHWTAVNVGSELTDYKEDNSQLEGDINFLNLVNRFTLCTREYGNKTIIIGAPSTYNSPIKVVYPHIVVDNPKYSAETNKIGIFVFASFPSDSTNRKIYRMWSTEDNFDLELTLETAPKTGEASGGTHHSIKYAWKKSNVSPSAPTLTYRFALGYTDANGNNQLLYGEQYKAVLVNGELNVTVRDLTMPAVGLPYVCGWRLGYYFQAAEYWYLPDFVGGADMATASSSSMSGYIEIENTEEVIANAFTANLKLIIAGIGEHIEVGKTVGVVPKESPIPTIEANITELEETKANIDGSYQQMTVGNAEQLVSSIKEEDKVPYLFRTSGGSIDIGDREEDKIVGGTVAWNQLAGNFLNRTETLGITISADNANGSITVTGTATATNNLYFKQNLSVFAGHKYLIRGAKSGGVRLSFTNSSVKDSGNGAIIAISANDTVFVIAAFNNGETFNETIYPQIFDLTQMFGSTIADYIYSLEQANAGAGVAWFRKLFPKDYYAYDAGTLKSVEGLTAHSMVGFNQWDEEWEVGSINNSTGANATNQYYLRSKNYIPILPNTSYHFHSGTLFSATNTAFKRAFYDADKNFLGYVLVTLGTNPEYTFTTPSDAHYMRFQVGDNTDARPVTTYNHDICINLSWDGSRNGEYEPYELHSYPLDSTLTLRGVPKLDANNQLYYDGDEYASDGTVTRRYGVVDLGTLNWSYSATRVAFDVQITNRLVADTVSFICAKYITGSGVSSASDVTSQADKALYYQKGNTTIFIKDSAYTDAATFKTAMSGVYLVYELATATTEEADPFQTPQIVNDFGTEEYVIDNTVTVPIPVGHDTFYQANLVAKLEMAPVSPEGDGDYIVRQTNGENAYVPITFPADELPAAPTTDGNYVLKCTVASGTATFTWEVQS